MSSTYEAGNARDLEFMVVVKTYPHPSVKYEETVCTGGITATGQWIRLYPVPFRSLDDKTFTKYQWVSCKAVKRADDLRPESYRPRLETLKLGDVVRTDHHWRERRSLLVPYARQSLEEIKARWHESKESAGMFKPKEVLEIVAEPAPAQWEQKYLDRMSQMKLWDEPKPLEKIPWQFKCVYRCDDPKCLEPHEQSIRDWEVYQLYRTLRRKYGDEEAVKRVKERTLAFFTDKYDTYLVVGSINRFCTFIIGGLFYPTRDAGATLPLWE